MQVKGDYQVFCFNVGLERKNRDKNEKIYVTSQFYDETEKQSIIDSCFKFKVTKILTAVVSN